MTNYTILVNGRSYDVTVQKKKTLADTPISTGKTVTPMAAVQPSLSAGGDGEKVTAPMPGKIIEIHVHEGERVKKGQALLIMEAMKMHNPILAANDGTISKLFVKVNESVQSGQPLLSIGT
ncbi:biotin/lipoyl-containing protein [Pelosinus propionicus]|uniref:Biotin-requiring enzyme n=1 Tax=Pelosinus propionicus DSM 13327 TaxID=1123291 RepID=A0A1I4IBV6_9FIRM|nr:biotin/lipoyl-containing protein [Pelosinus propionicus]SFL51241.1 Biotin-requiring enzyme [Pelosinus propionicus DSM 13327]